MPISGTLCSYLIYKILSLFFSKAEKQNNTNTKLIKHHQKSVVSSKYKATSNEIVPFLAAHPSVSPSGMPPDLHGEVSLETWLSVCKQIHTLHTQQAQTNKQKLTTVNFFVKKKNHKCIKLKTFCDSATWNLFWYSIYNTQLETTYVIWLLSEKEQGGKL